MRILFLTCALFAAGTQSAFAVKAASPKEISDIQAQIFLGNRMNSKIREAEIRLEAARSVRASPGDVIRLESALAREKDKQSAARTKAIHMTILAYDLASANKSGISVFSLTKGRAVTWIPVAREREERQIQNAEGTLQRRPQPKRDLAGKVYPDGVTYIYPGAFEKGAGLLASVLLHERIHFEQLTTPGKGDKMHRAESEAEAYQAEKDNESYFFDPQNPTDKAEMDAIAAELAVEQAWVKQLKKERATLSGMLRDLLRPSSPPDMFESKVHTNAELADISGLVAQARSHADKAHRDREKREAILRAAAERRDHDERLKDLYVEIARRSCANPGSVTQAELDGLPKPYGTDVMDTTPSGLGECAGLAYAYLRVGATAEDLRRNATPLVPIDVRPIPPPPQPAPVRASRPPAVVGAIPPPPFSTALPRFRDFAIAACGAPDQVSMEYFLHRPYDHSSRQRDDDLARSLAMGLGDCPRQLFDKLIATIRAGEWWRVDRQWIRSMVAAYTPVYVPPPSRGPRCEDFGVERCPCEDGTPGCIGGKPYLNQAVPRPG